MIEARSKMPFSKLRHHKFLIMEILMHLEVE